MVSCPSCRAYHGDLLVGGLPVALFASGHVFYVQNLGERLGAGLPYAVHNTYQFSGSAGKRQRLRERHLWNVVSALLYLLTVPQAMTHSTLSTLGTDTRAPDLIASISNICPYTQHSGIYATADAFVSNDCGESEIIKRHTCYFKQILMPKSVWIKREGGEFRGRPMLSRCCRTLRGIMIHRGVCYLSTCIWKISWSLQATSIHTQLCSRTSRHISTLSITNLHRLVSLGPADPISLH